MAWERDRETFNHIVKDAAQKKRDLYEVLLKQVPLLKYMDAYSRGNLADALRKETYEAGATIVRQGDPGDKFYLDEEGEPVAKKDGREVTR